MKLSIDKELLIKAINMVVKIADKHHRVAILGNIKLELSEESLVLTASDLEVELTTALALPQGACVQAGTTTLPAEKFFSVCKAVAGDVLHLDATGSRCVIGGEKGKYTLKALPAEDFPSIGAPSQTTTLNVNRHALFDLINHTRFAMATQDVRHYLTGMLFEIIGDKLTAVATDGHRLAVAHRALDESYDEKRIIIPGKAVGELERLLTELVRDGSEHDVVSLGFDDEMLQVSLNFGADSEYHGMSALLTARLIEGKFPDYRRVIPNNIERVALFDKEEAVDVLRRLSVLNSKEAPGVLLDFAKEDSVTISVRNREQDEAEEVMSVQYTGEPLELSFNEAYLRAVLRVLDGEIYLGMTQATSPTLIYQVGDEMNHQYVVMPMRV
ncbi:DNA polymerase III subunit beta [Moraxella caviae]|uniref:Beta sliding clamp n=1 Tax=Moraxella caviae TaxID=34060 RepID=A0A1S9ZXM3_9GAMM|nr:DNA polymerase III subunit beta [Moraxella caviae]OOR88159.1 DNA polymerase III subunit beta [Moraxella caviae]STZ10514.1 DNA polymerase III subunit beta [Moraxella caviae]VEW13205.1 DNA polymerase III subunit beta [Moraxella caviae]VEW14272.1 DNA polymerase III subunit beta [Moraxella caviae]